MARANGYIIAKQFQKQADNFEVSMDISADNSTLVFGYGPMLKLVSINTDVNFWFEDRKTIVRQLITCMDLNEQKMNIPNTQRVIRDVTWNDLSKNCLGVALGEAAAVYDVEDISNPKGFYKVFQTNDVMRQGDYPTKFIWLPNSKDQFLCTSSKSDQIVYRDIRKESIVATFNGSSSDNKTDHKIEDLKFNPVNPNIFATISKYSTIQIFDKRRPDKYVCRKESLIHTYNSNLLDWEWNGNRLASVFGGIINLWEFNGQDLIRNGGEKENKNEKEKQKATFEHKNVISDFKWLRKNPQYLLVSEMQENIIYGYRINQKKHDMEILVDPRHSGLKKFMTDRNQQLILGLTNFEDSKKHQHEMIAVFIDYESSKTIWSKTKFSKPNNFGIDNQLLFAATKKDYKGHVQSCYALQLQEVESSAKRIQKQMTDSQKEAMAQRVRAYKHDLMMKRKMRQNLRMQRKLLQKKVKQKNVLENNIKAQSSSQSPLYQKSSQKPLSQPKTKKLKKSSSFEQKEKQRSEKNLIKEGLDKKSNESFSQSSQEQVQIKIQKGQWILSYYQQVQYLDKHYRIQINESIPEFKGENICKHNSKVALGIGKYRCAQFWQYIYHLAFPQLEQKYTLSSLYEDKIKVDVYFKDNKIIASCENKSQIMKKVNKYNIEKTIQNLVDENQLQTAVMACVMIRNKDEKLLSLEFIQPFLICYKEILKAMGLTFISTNLSFIAKLNQAVPSINYSFDIPIGCGQCHKKFSNKKCNCLQVCIFCGQSLRDRLVIGCKICGHMAHAWQYQQWFGKQGQSKCKYRQCQHECFKI